MPNEKTPTGATRSEIMYFTTDGEVTNDPGRATSAEITEYAGGVAVQRTYVSRGAGEPSQASVASAPTPEWEPPGDAVDEPDVMDMTKSTWDVTVMEGGQVRFVETLPDLLTALGVSGASEAEQMSAVEEIRPLPSWAAAPPALREAVDEWLGSPSPIPPWAAPEPE